MRAADPYQVLIDPGIGADPRASLMRLRRALTTVSPWSLTDGMTMLSPKRVSYKGLGGASPLRNEQQIRAPRISRLVRCLCRQESIVYFGAGLVVLDLLLAALLAASGIGIGSWPAIALLAAIALVAERQSVRLTTTTEVSVSFIPFVFAGVMFGPLAAMLVCAVSLLGDITRRDVDRPLLRWMVWTASRTLVGAALGLAALAVGGPRTSSFFVFLAAAAAASFTEAVTDFGLNLAIGLLRRTVSLRAMLSSVAPVLLVAVALYSPVITVLAYAYREVSPWTFVMFLIPSLAAHRVFVLYQQQREALSNCADSVEMLEQANLSFAKAMVATLDARDRYTAGHSAAVAVYARDIARRMALSEREQQVAFLVGLVHDIGKVGLPPGLLEKAGKLSLEELRQMQEHAVIGERVLANVVTYTEIAAIVRHHHERIDGEGYPDRLAGDEIPLLARIIAVADSYNAMTSDRPYREAMAPGVARLRLARATAGQLDTAAVAAFEAVLDSENSAYQRGDFDLGPNIPPAQIEYLSEALPVARVAGRI